MDSISEDRARAAWELLRDHLEWIRVESGEQLLGYPQPVAECDLHYSDLLERRARVSEELSALMARQPGARPDDAGARPDDAWRDWLRERITASAFADDTLRQQIAHLLGGEKAL